jgi:hypothetical protein
MYRASVEDFLLKDFLRYLERGKVITLKEMDPVLELQMRTQRVDRQPRCARDASFALLREGCL